MYKRTSSIYEKKSLMLIAGYMLSMIALAGIGRGCIYLIEPDRQNSALEAELEKQKQEEDSDAEKRKDLVDRLMKEQYQGFEKPQ